MLSTEQGPNRVLRVSRHGSGIRLTAGPSRTDVHVALLVDPHLFLANLSRDAFGVVHGPLADADLFGHHRLLTDLDLFFSHGDHDIFALTDVARLDRARGVAGRRFTLDDDLLAFHRHIDGLCLGSHLLADAHLAGMDRLLLGVETLFLDLHRIRAA